MAIDFDRECFFIAPIGEDGSDIRRRSDGVKSLIVAEAAQAVGLRALRADEIEETGQITDQIVQHCLRAKMCVADLTGGNPNVYYELSVRHGKQLPVVLIAEESEIAKLPFDVRQGRVVFFRSDDYASGLAAREAVKDQISAALRRTDEGLPADNPISNGMRLASVGEGDPKDAVQLLIFERLERLNSTVGGIDARLRKAERQDALRAALRKRFAEKEKPKATWGNLQDTLEANDLAEQMRAEEAAGIVGVDEFGQPIFETATQSDDPPDASADA
jgi:hypothetical protein